MKRSGPKAPSAKPSRASKRSKSADRTFTAFACEACGLSQYNAPVATRWMQGHAVDLCQECWRAPLPVNAETLRGLLAARDSKLDRASRLDRDEMALDLAWAASLYADERSRSPTRISIGDAVRELTRIRELTKRDLPSWFRIRAARGAHLRGLLPSVNEDDPRVEPFHQLERDAFERALFGGVCAAWEVPVGFFDWVFDSAAAGEWIPLMGYGGAYRIEPRLGPYLDHTRWLSPPCVTWGRFSPAKRRGVGAWAVALNRKKGWSPAKKAIRNVRLADPKEQAVYDALLADIGARRGLPLHDDDLDREELKHRLHLRLCEMCRGKDGSPGPRPRSRKSHEFWCVDADGVEIEPKMSWLGDQLDRPWNRHLIFQATMAFPGGDTS